MGAFSNQILAIGARIVSRAAPEQGGVISGSNPSVYNPNDPFPLWVIQIIVIIAMTQFLAFFLGRIRQPRVIAEVIGGVILGPSIMGRIPGFTNTIFPAASIPLLTLTSTLGLVLFLFIVGLEIDLRLMKGNAKASAMISAVGLMVPLGLGAALAVPLYHEFVSPTVNFGYFVLFVAVSVGITAFPVLCRILSELKLIDTTVGVVVLAAGIGNDIVGWVLLALTVALVNASTGLTALYVLLTGVAFVLFMLLPVRISFKWLAQRTGSLETGQPTTLMMTLTLFIVLVSAFFTDIIGIHPIFGGFLAGLVIPHDNGFAIAVVEKMEDLVSIILLPLYFALSGLKTNLGLLNNGVTWGYTILICVVSFFSKFLGCSITAKLNGFNLRESGAIGALMSCKGLVELIALNVGFQAGILDTRTFSMFVLHALVLTFMTTPLTILLYPARVRVHAGVYNEKEGPSDGEEGSRRRSITHEEFKTKFAVILDRIEQIPAVMTITQLLQQHSTLPVAPTVESQDSKDEEVLHEDKITTLTRVHPLLSHGGPKISLDALRLIELTDRTSAVLKSQEADFLLHSDPIISVFRTFGFLNRIPVTASLSVVNRDEFSTSVARHVRETSSEMVIIPWKAGPATSEAMGDAVTVPNKPTGFNPFENMFRISSDQPASTIYSHFIRKVFADSPTDVALIIDRGIVTGTDFDQHIFLPFFGGPDDRLALSFVVQLCTNSSVSATVVRFRRGTDLTPSSTIEAEKAGLHGTVASQHNTLFPDTVYGFQSTQTRLASDTADNLLWERYSSPATSHIPQVQLALTRVSFREQSSSRPLHAVVDIGSADARTKRSLLVVGRSRRMATESHLTELKEIIAEKSSSVGSEVMKTLGEVAAAFVAGGVNANMVVLQASSH